MLSPLGHDDQNQVSAGLRCAGICRVLPMGSKTELTKTDHLNSES